MTRSGTTTELERSIARTEQSRRRDSGNERLDGEGAGSGRSSDSEEDGRSSDSEEDGILMLPMHLPSIVGTQSLDASSLGCFR